jgi:hydroxyacylglutathione hydrolase
MMIRETFPVGALHCNCTILGDEATRDALIIDPGADIPLILAALARHRLTARQILITHAHFDHIAAAQQLKELTGAPIVYSQADLPLVAMMATQPRWIGLTWEQLAVPVPTVLPPDHSPADNETLSIGNYAAHVLYTPGHTPGSLAVHVPSAALLVAGDTLFAGSVGRTDFPLGNSGQLLESIQTRFLNLPDNTVVIPGHGPSTTIATERLTNPFLS